MLDKPVDQGEEAVDTYNTHGGLSALEGFVRMGILQATAPGHEGSRDSVRQGSAGKPLEAFIGPRFTRAAADARAHGRAPAQVRVRGRVPKLL
jgi:hypothetical protein